MREHLRDLAHNYRSGFRLARFGRVGADDFQVSTHLLVLLIAVDIMLAVLTGYFKYLPQPEFNPYAIPVYGFHSAALLLCAYLVSLVLAGRPPILAFPTAILSLTPALYVLWYPLNWLADSIPNDSEMPRQALYVVYLAWLLVVAYRAIVLTATDTGRRYAAAFGIVLVSWVGPTLSFSEYAEFWYAAYEDDGDDEYARYRKLDVESMFYAQTPLLNRALDNIAVQRDGIVDIYFLGFAGYARQDVFIKETRYAGELFDRRFDTQGRSLLLANNISSYETIPLATSHNLRDALRGIGARMNTEEDVLVLFMTSHGSRNHALSVDFWPLTLNDLTPTMLKQYLDEAGIKWRVLLISACYSGGFIEPLQDDHTLLATASAADSKSFGCGDHNDFTYFGEAVLKDQLSHRYSLLDALPAAVAAIEQREQAERLEPSKPQTFVGASIRQKLMQLEPDLAARHCGATVSVEC